MNLLGNGVSNFEKILQKSHILFTMIVMYQGLFGGLSMSNPPSALTDLQGKMWFKFVTLFCIAFTATKDIEISIISVVCFVLTLYAMKTPEERNKGLFSI
jgi:hypothetical protein